jgi:tyrocidine synthetase-3
MEDGDKLYFIFEYCTRLFKKETIKRFITYFRNIVTAVLNGMEQRISAIDILSRNEREQLLYGFNDTGAHYPLDKSIHRLFEEQADRVPHQVALLYEEPGASGNIEVTYNQLNKKANQLALLLRARGITVDTIVGLLLEPSIDMIVGMLAALKAGGAYMPIEPGCPVNRLKGMVQDSSVAVFLTRQTGEARVGECGYTREVIRLDQLPDVLVEKEKQNPLHIKSPQDLAYVIFTSGSTGKPKGTLISHENVVRLMVNDKNPFVFNSSDVWTLFHSYCFDFSVWEMYGALLYGGKLLIIPRMMARDTQQFLAGLKKHAVTVLNQTPSAFYNLAAMELENPGKQLKLRYVIFGGEALNPAKLDRWYEKYPETRLINMFGITETTVHVTFKELKKREIERGISNIGKPIPTLTTYVTDKHQQLLPIVVPGELCVGGKGVARGYLNRPELTAEKFCLRRPGGALFIKTAPVKHLDSPYKNFLLKGLHKDHMQSCHHAAMQLSPYQSPQYPITPLPHFLIYRSGDLVTLLENGDMVYSGRIDHQVKIRGYRVELEEIAHQIMSHEAVREAVVVDRADNNGDKQLVAYVVPGSQFTLPDLQVFLKKHLPDYMVPPVVVLLDKLPLTPNGKINRRELPESGNVETSISDSPAPGNEREKKLAEIWSDLLGIKKDTIGIHTNFFQSGGQSLKAAVLRTRIHKAFNVKIPMSEIFQRPTIKEMDDYIQGAATDNYTPLQWVEKRDFYALSSAQKRLYILQQMEMANIAYNLPAIMKLEGELRTKGFEEAIKRLIDRHESLRTSFHMIDEQPVQRVHDEVEFEIEYYDSGNRQKAKGKKEEKMPNAYYLMPESLIKNFIRPFDLSRAPLLRIELIKTGEQEHMLMIDMHHIVMDGISLGIFIEEFMMIYGGGKIPVLRHRYKEFLAWQNTEKKAQTFKKQEEYWKKQFEGGIPVLNLPTDYNRPLVSSSAGNQVSFRLSSSETNGLKELGMTERASLFMVLLSVFNVLLFKITGQEDIVVGTPVAGRRHAELQRIIGMFVNTLALRNYPWGEKNHRELLREIKERTLSAFENQDYPFEDLVEQVEINRDTGRNPVFSVMLVLQDMDLPEPEIPGLKLQTLHHGPGGGRFDMTLFAREDRDELAFTLEYGTKLFKKETIIRYVEYFKRIVSLAPGNPDAMLGQIEVIGEAEKRQLIVDFNNTGARYPKEKTLHELFEEQVEKTTDNTAVVFEDQKLTYRVLNQKANQLAQVLRAKNISPDKVVSIMVQPSVEMMVGIFGILKTGGSYLPIDPEYPGKRKNYILQDSKTELVLTSLRAFPGINHESDVGNLNDICEIIDLGDGCLYNGDGRNPEGGNTSTDLAYVIYTSGSIGTPKGVTISHQNVVNFIEGITSRIAFESDKSILALTTISFDIFVLETLLPLIKGLKVIIATQQQRLDPDLLKKIVKNNQMDMIQSTPSRLQLMTEDLHWLKGVKVLMVGGETFPNNLFEGLKKEFGGKIYNLYGPTETTIWSTLKDLTGAGGITIGTPIANTYIYILNRYMGLQPVGAGGELCIGGDGTARGYLNKPELTAEKFNHDFWDYHDEEKKGTNKKLNKKLLQGVQGGGFLEKSPPGRRRQKIYKTGDLARWLQDGEIQFLGRIDHQVKIRGFRIELEEIENHLLQLESVKEVIVSDKEINGNKCLCAFMVSDNEIEISEMRNKLSKVLPSYMIPSYFVQLKKLSLTPNGKIDRKALPDPELTGGDRYTRPRDEMEKRMVKIWAELLHLEENVIGIDTNFFSLGGHSLKAMILATKIHKELDVKIPLAQIFKISSIKGLARYIEQAEQYKSEVVQPVEEKEYYPLTHAQRGILVQQWKLKGVMAYNIPQLVPLDFDVDKDRLSHTFKKLICRHESLRSSFHMIDGKAVQRIQPGRDMELTIEYHDMTGMAGITGQDPRLTSILRDFIRVFNLSQAPLLRVGLIQLKDKKYLLEIDMHHIVTDGVSMEILRKELMELYNSEQLAPIKIQYKDYVVWQRSKKVKEAIDKQKGFWLKNFAGEIPVVNLPLDFKRPTIKRFDGDRIFFTVDSRLTHRLNRLAEHSEATLYMVLLAVYFILLSTFDNPGDIVVGSPVTGRKHADLHNIIGMFVNMLAIKSRPAAEKTFREFLEEVKGIVIDSLENQDYQYGDFIGELGLIGNLSRNPLFDVVFAMHNIRTYVNGNENLENNRYSMELLTAKFDLLLGAAENDGKIVMKFEYSTQLFKRSTVEKMSKHYLEILQQVTAYPDIPRENIEMPHDRVAMKAIDHYDDGDFGF